MCSVRPMVQACKLLLALRREKPNTPAKAGATKNSAAGRGVEVTLTPPIAGPASELYASLEAKVIELGPPVYVVVKDSRTHPILVKFFPDELKVNCWVSLPS